MSALPTGAHTLKLHLVIRRPGEPERFEAYCSCGEWESPGTVTRAFARIAHATHMQAVVAETEANDEIR